MPSSQPNWRQRLSYYFDKTLARGPSALIGWLALATALLIALATTVDLLAHGVPDQSSPLGVLWNILSQALTPNPVDSNNPWQYLLVMLAVTLGSLFIVSILIGILSNEIQARVDLLRRGRSKVLESDHTVILGWSHQVFTIISELIIANENRTEGAVVVILADKDKVEMEDEIRAHIHHIENTRVICRSGDPIELADIEIVSPHTARSIIVLPPDEDDPDIFVIKTILAITNNPKRRNSKYHIVTQLRDEKHLDVVQMIGQRDDVQAVMVEDLIARVIAQTSRQSGLSMVYTELLNFEGDEIYFQEEPTLMGKTFGEALLAYETSSVMGLRQMDGTILLNPSMDTLIKAGDEVFAISEDDDTVKVSGLPSIPVDIGSIKKNESSRKTVPEEGLILGWNRYGLVVVRELDAYVAPGSHLTIVANTNAIPEIKESSAHLIQQETTILSGDTTDRRLLDSLNLANFDYVIVLADSNMEVQESDARTLVTLLHLRDILEKYKEAHFIVVSEMLDLRNRQLADVAHVDDFVVSEHLPSLMMSQLSENSELQIVFADLFSHEGSEIYLKPIGNYIETGKPINFYTVVESARRRGEIAIGYRIMTEINNANKSYGVHTNPKKSEMVRFTPEDKIIVVAEK